MLCFYSYALLRNESFKAETEVVNCFYLFMSLKPLILLIIDQSLLKIGASGRAAGWFDNYLVIIYLTYSTFAENQVFCSSDLEVTLEKVVS